MADATPTLQAILDAAAGVLDAGPNPVGGKFIQPGSDVAWDNCCPGVVYLRVLEVFPTAHNDYPFPLVDQSSHGAAPAEAIMGIGWHLALGTLRCAPTLDSQGNPPHPDSITAAAKVQQQDLDAIMQTIVCTVPSLKGVKKIKLDRYQPLPGTPDGGCTGGEWGFYVMIDPCFSCGADGEVTV